MRSQDVIDK